MSNERLREHPAKRFAGPEHLLDLSHEFEALLQEPHQGTQTHRQEVLYKHGPVTISIFSFDQDGFLSDHVVNNGSVVIQVLEGMLVVHTLDSQHDMNSGSLLVLAAGVVHSVRASQPVRMLLSVYLHDPN